MPERIDFASTEFSPVEYRITRPKPAQTNRVALIQEMKLHPRSPLGMLRDKMFVADSRPTERDVERMQDDANAIAAKLKGLKLGESSPAEFAALRSELEMIEMRIAQAESLARERVRDDDANKRRFDDAYSRYYCLVRQLNFEAEFLSFSQREKIENEIAEMTKPTV